MAGHDNPNYVAENPFEGRGRALQSNDAIEVMIGFVVSGGFFALLFLIAIIIEVATR